MGPLFYTMPLTGGLIVATLGLLLLAVARQGRRQGTQPHCARCNYNLRGHDPAARDAKCPECGAPLGLRHAVRVGARRGRPLMMTFALVFLVVGLAGTLLSGIQLARRMDWYTFSRTTTLLRDAGSTNGALRDHALAILNVRRLQGKLDAAQRETFGDHLLTLATDPHSGGNFMWLSGVAVPLADMAAHGGLTPDQQRRYFDGLVRPELRVRPEVLPGRALPAELFVLSYVANPYIARVEIAAARVDGAAVELPDIVLAATSPMPEWRDLRIAGPFDAGDHTLSLDVRCEVFDLSNVTPDAAVPLSQHTPVRSDLHTLEAAFHALDAAPAEPVARVPATNTNSIPANVQVTRVSVLPSFNWDTHQPYVALIVDLAVRTPAQDWAFDVVASDGPHTTTVGSFAASSTTRRRSRSFHLESPAPDWLTDRVSLRLATNPLAALETVDITQVADATVELGTFTVQDFDRIPEWRAKHAAATQPTTAPVATTEPTAGPRP